MPLHQQCSVSAGVSVVVFFIAALMYRSHVSSIYKAAIRTQTTKEKGGAESGMHGGGLRRKQRWSLLNEGAL